MPCILIPALCLDAAEGVHTVRVCSTIPQGLEEPPTGFQQEEALQTALEAALCSAVPGLCNTLKHVSVLSNNPTGGQLEPPAVPADDPGGDEGPHGNPESVFSEGSAEPAAPGGPQEQPGTTTQSGTAPGVTEGDAAAPHGVDAEAGESSAVVKGALGEVPFRPIDASVSEVPLQPGPMEGPRAGEATTEVRCLWPCLSILFRWPPALSAAASCMC